MKIKLDNNSISAVLYNYLRQEDILFEIKDGYIQFHNEKDYQKVLDFLPEEKKILARIEEEVKKIPEYDEKVDQEIKKSEKKKGGRLF